MTEPRVAIITKTGVLTHGVTRPGQPAGAMHEHGRLVLGNPPPGAPPCHRCEAFGRHRPASIITSRVEPSRGRQASRYCRSCLVELVARGRQADGEIIVPRIDLERILDAVDRLAEAVELAPTTNPSDMDMLDEAERRSEQALRDALRQ